MERNPDYVFIGGEFLPIAGADRIRLENPADRTVVGSVVVTDAAHVNLAVAAAAAALPAWRATSVRRRADVLGAIASGIRARSEELAALISEEMGAPINLSRRLHVELGAAVYDYHVRLVQDFAFEREQDGAHVVMESAGVAVAITPWNVSPFLIACKLAPALAAGCTVILKPSELTSLSALLFAEVVRDAGVPAGVLNVVTGTGPKTGDYLVRHPDVRVVSFTGSGAAGSAIAIAAAPTVKNLALELGGKSANIVFSDADLETAVTRNVASAFTNSGQVCAALTRLLVERSSYDEAISIAIAAAQEWQLGDPTSESSRVGPVASAAQYDRVTRMIQTGVDEGARVVYGGLQTPAEFSTGYYVNPTILVDVDPASVVAQEEIFGPVLSIIPFDREEDAIAIANGTKYGLSGAVWSGDEDRALRVARAIETGSITINGRGGSLTAPFGGVKQSGRGREWGSAGMHEYLETKAIFR